MWWLSWASGQTVPPMCVSLPGLQDGGGREGQGPSALLSPSPPPWRYHPGGALGPPSPTCYPEGGPQTSWALLNCCHPHSILTQLAQSHRKRGAPASRGQQDPLTQGRSHASPPSSLHYVGCPARWGDCPIHGLLSPHQPAQSWAFLPPPSTSKGNVHQEILPPPPPPPPTPRLKQGSVRTSSSKPNFDPRGWSTSPSSLSPWNAGPGPILALSPFQGKGLPSLVWGRGVGARSRDRLLQPVVFSAGAEAGPKCDHGPQGADLRFPGGEAPALAQPAWCY